MLGRSSLVLALASGLLLPAPAALAADYGCVNCGGGDYSVDYSGKGGDHDRYVVDPDSKYFMSDDDQSHADPNQNFVLRGSVGIAGITANEHVYYFTTGPQNLSLLKWESLAPMASADAKLRLGDAWTLRGHIDAAMSGDSTMTDYDWLGFSPSLSFDDWDHRSISPNTSLDWYLNGSLAIGRDMPVSDAFTVNFNGGVKYTDVQWTAKGGTYIYSTAGFRDTTGTIPDVNAVRYRQQLPTAFLGADATIKDGAWSLDATTKVGLLVSAQSQDHHYLRVPPMIITDNLSWGSMASIDARLGYDISEHLGAFLEGSYEKVVATHTPSTYTNMNTGAVLSQSNTVGGAELDTWSLKAGLKGQF